MPDVEMTLQARGVLTAMHAEHGRYDIGVAGDAGTLGDSLVVSLDENVVGNATGGECERVQEAVRRLDGVLPCQVMRRVTVVAFGGDAMAGLHPPGVILVHDVAVGAGSGIVAEVGVAPGIHER